MITGRSRGLYLLSWFSPGLVRHFLDDGVNRSTPVCLSRGMKVLHLKSISSSSSNNSSGNDNNDYDYNHNDYDHNHNSGGGGSSARRIAQLRPWFA